MNLQGGGVNDVSCFYTLVNARIPNDYPLKNFYLCEFPFFQIRNRTPGPICKANKNKSTQRVTPIEINHNHEPTIRISKRKHISLRGIPLGFISKMNKQKVRESFHSSYVNTKNYNFSLISDSCLPKSMDKEQPGPVR